MKIAIVDNTPEGGAKRVVFEQVKGLAKDHEVHYFTNEVKSIFPFDDYAHNIKRFPLTLPDYRGLLRPIKEVSIFTSLLSDYAKIAESIDDLKMDVVLTHPCRITQAPLILTLLKTPSLYYMEEWLRIVYEPNLDPLNKLSGMTYAYEGIRRKTLKSIDFATTRQATRLIANSVFTAGRVLNAYRKKADVIHPGVDATLFKPKKDSLRKYFLFVGNPNSENGYPLLSEALKRAHIPIKTKIVSFNKNAFTFSDTDLVTYYQEAVATLCLAVDEPFGLTAIESLASGTPVIAVSEGGYLETVNEKNGIFIERDPDQLIKAIKKMAVDQDLRKELGTNGRKEMKVLFTWQSHLEKLERLMHEISKN